MTEKELKKIAIGSMDVYVVEWNGTIPADNVIEQESNLAGRTKNGATLGYEAEWYTAKSDDGKAQRRALVGDSASLSYGNITWNGETLGKYIATARVGKITDGKRRTKIGGASNDNGKKYLIRGVHKDKVKGDIRITGVGINTGGWEAVFAPNNESVITPKFEFDPELDNEGTLLYYDEEIEEENTTVPDDEDEDEGEQA